MNAQTATAKVQELMAGGMTMEEALAKVLEKTPVERIDRIAFMNDCNDLEALRKAIKVAFAKKSKASTAKDPEASRTKYEQEIKAGQERLNEILRDINAAEDPIAKAIEYNEAPSGLVQIVLDSLTKISEERVADSGLKGKALKDCMAELKPEITADVKAVAKDNERILTELQERIKKNDQRVIAVLKKMQIVFKPVEEAPVAEPAAKGKGKNKPAEASVEATA